MHKIFIYSGTVFRSRSAVESSYTLGVLVFVVLLSCKQRCNPFKMKRRKCSSPNIIRFLPFDSSRRVFRLFDNLPCCSLRSSINVCVCVSVCLYMQNIHSACYYSTLYMSHIICSFVSVFHSNAASLLPRIDAYLDCIPGSLCVKTNSSAKRVN